MLTTSAFETLLNAHDTLILDGALATELEARGHDLNHALWSAKILKDDPESILEVHLDYYLAGADVAITASYQASTQGLIDHFALSPDKAGDLVKKSVTLAKEARARAYDNGVSQNRTLLVAGSVGPYGAYLADGSEYRGDYSLSKDGFQTFHRPRIAALIEAGVDLLAIETLPNMQELRALLDLLAVEFPDAIAWIGCTVKDAQHLCDGTPLHEVVDLVMQHRDRVVAVGVNCIPLAIVVEAVRSMSSATGDKPMPLLCYPNLGEVYDATTKTWHGAGATSDSMGVQVLKWRTMGARLIGGCCRTGPQDIELIAKTLRK